MTCPIGSQRVSVVDLFLYPPFLWWAAPSCFVRAQLQPHLRTAWTYRYGSEGPYTNAHAAVLITPNTALSKKGSEV